jgi:hypothetical protein
MADQNYIHYLSYQKQNYQQFPKIFYDDNEPNQNNPDIIKPIGWIHSNHATSSLRTYIQASWCLP